MASSESTKKKLETTGFTSVSEQRDLIKKFQRDIWKENKQRQIHLEMIRDYDDFKSLKDFYDDWTVEVDNSLPELLRYRFTDKFKPKMIISGEVELKCSGPEFLKAIIDSTWSHYTADIQKMLKIHGHIPEVKEEDNPEVKEED